MSPRPGSAVPVFPATGMPGIAPFGPVPPVRAACIVELSSDAASERLRRFRVAGVSDLLPVLDAVTRIVELGVGREAAAVQRRGRGHDLEGGAGLVAAGRGAVHERAALPARAQRLREVLLDQVRVV